MASRMMTRRMARKTARKVARKMTRKMNPKAMKWTGFVKKIYQEMKKKNPNVKLGEAMKEASKRKSEM
jgi:hypothetical protein